MSLEFDMDPREFSRHNLAAESRFIMDELRKNDPQSEQHLDRLTVDYTHVTDSTNFLLAFCECPPEFRGFIDALVGLAGYRAKGGEWFKASDEEIARRANRRSTKWVQNQRKRFLKWQTRNNVAMVDIEDNKYNEGQPIPHKYRVNLARIAAESTLNARQSVNWGRNPGIALQEAAQTMRDSLPEVPVHKRHRKSFRPDAETRIGQELSYALTKVKNAKQTNELTGNNIKLTPKMLETIANLRSELDDLVKKAG